MKDEKKIMWIVGIGLLNTMLLILGGLFSSKSSGETMRNALEFFKGMAIGLTIVANIVYIVVMTRLSVPRRKQAQY